MELNYIDGCYKLSFFNIRLKTNEELSRNVIEKNKSTFIHEFIHYLQDLILPYNIRYNLSNVRCFFNVLEFAHKHGNIIRPFNDWSEESRNLMMQFERSIGGVTENNRVIDTIARIGNPTSSYVTFSGFDGNLQIQRQHRVYKYFLPVYKEGTTNPITYNLGARDILEYIAYKIELRNFPNRPSAPQLPYESIDLIFDKYELSHISDDIRLCIAECCLYNDTPIHFLFILLNNDEFKKFITNSNYEEIYDYLLFSSTVTRDGHSESLIAKTQRRLIQFSDELLMQYSCFDEIGNWILKINDFVKSELFGRFVFSDMYKMRNDELNEFINSTIYQIGIPLMINSKEKYISIQSSEMEVSQFIQFYILQNFIDFVKSESALCPIYNFCKANGGVCNENCTLNPHMKISGNMDCYYAKFLKSYGLYDVKFE